MEFSQASLFLFLADSRGDFFFTRVLIGKFRVLALGAFRGAVFSGTRGHGFFLHFTIESLDVSNARSIFSLWLVAGIRPSI